MPLWSDPSPIRYNAGAGNIAGLGDNLASGAQQATPAVDRAKIEEALKFYAGGWPESRYPHMAALREAARAHLETLPKPEPARWHVTASKHGPEGTTAAPPYVTESHEVALAYARGYVNQGYTNVNIRRVRS